MTNKIPFPVLSNEDKQTLYWKTFQQGVIENLPSVSKGYRWQLKVSKDKLLVFELELQKKDLWFWKRSVSYYISLDMLKKSSVEECLNRCADSLLDTEEEKISKLEAMRVNWINEEK